MIIEAVGKGKTQFVVCKVVSVTDVKCMQSVNARGKDEYKVLPGDSDCDRILWMAWHLQSAHERIGLMGCFAIAHSPMAFGLVAC